MGTIWTEGGFKKIALSTDRSGNDIESTYATKNEVNNRIEKIIGAAPDTLDTLEEIAARLKEINIEEELAAKVDKVLGKGLSTNDFTSTLKTKLDNINSTIPENKYIPSGGKVGLILVNVSDGTAEWKDSMVNDLYKKVQTLSEELYCYGVEWDINNPSPVLTRIGNPTLHKSLPIQSAYRGCVANNGTVNYYLSPNNWEFKQDGVTPSILDGTDGTVRVHTPKFYGKSGSNGTKRWVKISLVKIDDTWVEIPEMLMDAYRSTVDTTLTPKAVSVVNSTPSFRGGGNRTEYDLYLSTDIFRSDICKPRTNLTRAEMRTYATNAGSEMLCYEYYKWIFYWAYIIEYANFNCQIDYNPKLTSDGYKQGGLGAGVTIWTYTIIRPYNGVYPSVTCGYCNSIGNFTGVKDLVMDRIEFKVPRWRGFDNPFGDIATALDGIIIQSYTEEDENIDLYKNVYTTTDPTKFGDTEEHKEQMKLVSNKAVFDRGYASGYIMEFDLKETAEIIPLVTNNKDEYGIIYMCDYHYTSNEGTNLTLFLVGGSCYTRDKSGLGYSDSGYDVNTSTSDCGFRTLNRII